MEEEIKVFLRVIPSKKGKILYCVSRADDLSKLDLKGATDLSMSTVLSSVDKLREEGWITVVEEKKPSGGKPRSRINVSPNVCVCGVSYKAGILTAVRTNFKGEVKGKSEIAILDKGAPPFGYAASALKEVLKGKDAPAAIGLAMNVADPDRLCEEVEKAFGAPVFLTSNTGAIATLTLFRERAFPIAAIGVGVKVKFAFCAEKMQTSDLSDLFAPCVSNGGATFGAVLSVPEVERRLREEDYRNAYSFNGERFAETRDKRGYSETLVGSIVALVRAAVAFTLPQRLVLFGDYLSEGLYERVKRAVPDLVLLRRVAADRAEFALGAAYYALKEGVFNE